VNTVWVGFALGRLPVHIEPSLCGSGRVWGGGRIRNWDGVGEADEQSSQSLGVAAVAGL
jgi:hypothetical protein